MAHSAKLKNKTQIRSAEKMPAHWDNTLTDFTEMKASPSEIARRRAVHTSKNQLAAKIELQRRAVHSAVKSAKKPLPAVFVREVLPKPENVCSEVTDLSPQTLAMCADRILERSARLTAPSVCSSSDLHNVNPAVTKLPENLNDSCRSGEENEASSKMLPVQITPMVRTRLDRLAEAVTAPAALNEPALLENERKRTNSSLSNDTKTSSSKVVATNNDAKPTAPSISSVQGSENSSNKQQKTTEVKKNSRLPEKVAVLEQLFWALQIDATEAGLLAKPAENDDDASSLSSTSTLSGHTALLVRVLIGLVARIRQLESQLSEMNAKMESMNPAPVSSVNALTEKVTQCERKIDGFQEELRQTSGATTESLQRIRSELENICINKSPPLVANTSSQNVNAIINLPPVMDQELDDFGDDFDAEPWLNSAPVNSEKNAPLTAVGSENRQNNENNENFDENNGNQNQKARSGSISPPPSSIHFPSGESATSSIMFGDRLGMQLAELTRQHEQARARLQAMQRSVHSMGRFGIASKP